MNENTFTPVRIGVVGVGTMGRWHALTLQGIAEAQLVALVDSNEAGLKSVAEEAGGHVRTFTDANEALRDADVEAWVIATPTESHVDLTITALSGDTSVLLEKPMARSVADAQRLAPHVAADSGNLMLGHIVLFAAEYQALLGEVQQHGKPVHFHAFRHRPIDSVGKYPNETPLSLTMVHDLYLAYVLMNGAEPASMRARHHRNADGKPDLTLAELTWQDGTIGSFTTSFLTPPGMPTDGYDRFELFGSGWAAQMRLNPQGLTVFTDRARWPLSIDVFIDTVAPAGWLAEELRHFCRVVRGCEPARLGVRYEDAMRIQSWLETLETSAAGL